MNASVKLLESVLPASVALRVTVPAAHPSAAILGTERMGSGTLIDRSGVLLTVNYVVVGASEIEATLIDGTTVPGEVVAQDYHAGIAAVRVPTRALPVARPARRGALAPGEDVFIVAAAGGSERRVNAGVVSAIAPFDAYWEYHLERSILTTAMNPGFGGGALYTVSGTLAGVVSLDLGEVGKFTLAIPSELFFDHHEELLRHGYRTTRPARAWVGFFCYELQQHIVVGGVLPGAPGERAGIRPGDVILSIDGERIRERKALYRRLWTHRPGELVNFEVFRDSNIRQVAVEAGNAELFFA